MPNSEPRTTLLTHIFNEEYLLPFWLQHHKNLFDDLIVVDYNSTDSSIDICKRLWPGCTIRQSRNEFFGADEVDQEIMDIENDLSGVKMVLNTTEFLFCQKPIKQIFTNTPIPIIYSVQAYEPYSKEEYNPETLETLIGTVLQDNFTFHKDRGCRIIHNYKNGAYVVGRHGTKNKCVFHLPELSILWFGFYPMNEKVLKRKLQIGSRIPQKDKERGFGTQHYLYNVSKLMDINQNKAENGKKLEDLNPSLYSFLSKQYSLKQ